MNRLFVVSAFLVASVVVACGAPAATPTTAPSPTVAPTATRRTDSQPDRRANRGAFGNADRGTVGNRVGRAN